MSCKKGEKSQLAMCVVNAIKSQNPPGRFLEFEPKIGSWIEVDEARTIEKTYQTFRKKCYNDCCTFNSIDSNKKITFELKGKN